jgi:hypothetical protein
MEDAAVWRSGISPKKLFSDVEMRGTDFESDGVADASNNWSIVEASVALLPPRRAEESPGTG